MTEAFTDAEEKDLREAFTRLGGASTYGKGVLIAAVRRLFATLDAERAAHAAGGAEAVGRTLSELTPVLEAVGYVLRLARAIESNHRTGRIDCRNQGIEGLRDALRSLDGLRASTRYLLPAGDVLWP